MTEAQDGSRVDEFVPDPEHVTAHATIVAAPAPVVYAAIEEVEPGDLLLMRVLMGARTLPMLLLRRLRPSGPRRTLVETMTAMGFVVLARDDPRELVLGAIGQFWRLDGGRQHVPSAEAFRAFSTPGFVKAAMTFRVDPYGSDRVRLRTETRVVATDPEARRRFARYWRIVRPGSGLIRWELLRAVRRRAEAQVAKR